MTNTTRKSVSSLRGWTMKDAAAWMQAHCSELPYMQDFTRVIGKETLATKGAGQYDPHFHTARTEAKNLKAEKADVLPALNATQLALRTAWAAQELVATIEVVKSYKTMAKVESEPTLPDYSARGNAIKEMKAHGQLNTICPVLGDTIPGHLTIDGYKQQGGNSTRQRNNLKVVSGFIPEVGIEDPAVDDLMDWARANTTEGNFRAIMNWIGGEAYTSRQKMLGINTLKAAAATLFQVKRNRVGRVYHWTTAVARFTTLGNGKGAFAPCTATPTQCSKQHTAEEIQAIRMAGVRAQMGMDA